MTDSHIKINQPEINDTDGKIDTTQLTQDGGDVVDRERMHLGGAGPNDLADVSKAFGLEVEVTHIRPPTAIVGGPVTVETTEAELTFAGVTLVIMIQSAIANTGTIWFGPTGVTNSGGNAYGELSPGASVEIEYNDAAAGLFIISDTSSQSAYASALT